jgi:hypothetical protein
LYSEEGGRGGETCSCCHENDPDKFVQMFLAVNFKGNIIVKLPVIQRRM